jgi:hypothetical protein
MAYLSDQFTYDRPLGTKLRNDWVNNKGSMEWYLVVEKVMVRKIVFVLQF